MLVKGAISIKRRRVAGDTMMMSLADKKKVVKIALSKTLQANGLQQEWVRYQHLPVCNVSIGVG